MRISVILGVPHDKASNFAAVGIALRARTAQVFRRARARLQTWAVRTLRAIMAGVDMNFWRDMNFSFEIFVQKSKPCRHGRVIHCAILSLHACITP